MNKFQLAETTTDSKILEQLSHDENFYVRCRVAENSNTSVETLKLLSHDKVNGVRCCVAWNSNTSAETLNFLSRDEHYWVRNRVAHNSNTSFEILKQMAIHDEYDNVREYILKNSNCPNELYMYIGGRKLLQMLNKEQMYS